MCLYCLNFTEERRNIFPHCSLRSMICKSLHGSSRKNSITFRKRTIQLSKQNTYSKHFHCNLAYFEQAGQMAILLQYPPLHLQKLTLTQAHGCGFLYSPSPKQAAFQWEEHKQKSSLHLRPSSGSLGRIPHKAASAVLGSPTSPFQFSLPTTGPPDTYLDTPAWGEW